MPKSKRALQPIKFRDFDKVVRSLGFTLDRVRGSHYICVNDKHEMISVGFKGKEINPMMWKLIQQRLLHNNLRITQRFNEL